MAKSKNTVKTAEEKTGKKHIKLIDPEGSLEETFQDIIAKGGKIDLLEAGEYDNCSEFACFIKRGLNDGNFTKVEFLEALYKDCAESEYESYKDSYDDTEDAFVNFIQDDHGPYVSVLVCETEDEIYLALVIDCYTEEGYSNMLKELALAITNIHPARIPAKEPSKEVLDIMSKLTTTDKRPTGDSKTVNLNNVLNDVLNGQPTPGASVKALTAPMFTKL